MVEINRVLVVPNAFVVIAVVVPGWGVGRVTALHGLRTAAKLSAVEADVCPVGGGVGVVSTPCHCPVAETSLLMLMLLLLRSQPFHFHYTMLIFFSPLFK